ncbi:MAG: hydrogenase iron-sulfur subunit [Kiritimatiellaeota bacterium]|nr:hydrogenase iron-sulfur subunit [Kiritimatiellota bacterium]
MPAAFLPDVIVYVCRNSLPGSDRAGPRRWRQAGLDVVLRELPCSGKTDPQYMLHALQSGTQGLCVVTCPPGTCRLAQGNYRAKVRVRTVQRLLEEIGMDPARAALIHATADDSPAEYMDRIRDAIDRIAAAGPNPITLITGTG